MEILESVNAHLGTCFSLDSNWQVSVSGTIFIVSHSQHSMRQLLIMIVFLISWVLVIIIFKVQEAKFVNFENDSYTCSKDSFKNTFTLQFGRLQHVLFMFSSN